MKTLKLDLIDISEAAGDFFIDKDTVVLEFNYDGGWIVDYETPYSNEYGVYYKTNTGDYREIPEVMPNSISIENYHELEKHIDDPKALPELYFDIVDGDKVIESGISLRDFMKNLVFNGDILEQAEKRLDEYLNEAI